MPLCIFAIFLVLRGVLLHLSCEFQRRLLSSVGKILYLYICFSIVKKKNLFHSSDLFKYRFVNCKLINSTFLHNKEGCILDFSDDFNNAYMIYFVNFLGTLAVLPGNIVSALLMDKIGRLRMLGR